MGRKFIQVGTLADGDSYRYDPDSDSWFCKTGRVWEQTDFIPYLYIREPDGYPGQTREMLAYFHSKTHKWLDTHYTELPTGLSDKIDCAFRRQYNLNGRVRLLTLEEQEEKPGQTEDFYKNPIRPFRFEEIQTEEPIDPDELLTEARELYLQEAC